MESLSDCIPECRRQVAKGDIVTASYYMYGESRSPGDTAASFVFTNYVWEYRNSPDTSTGSSFVILDSLTGTKASFCYDINMRATFYEEEKGMLRVPLMKE